MTKTVFKNSEGEIVKEPEGLQKARLAKMQKATEARQRRKADHAELEEYRKAEHDRLMIEGQLLIDQQKAPKEETVTSDKSQDSETPPTPLHKLSSGRPIGTGRSTPGHPGLPPRGPGELDGIGEHGELRNQPIGNLGPFQRGTFARHDRDFVRQHVGLPNGPGRYRLGFDGKPHQMVFINGRSQVAPWK